MDIRDIDWMHGWLVDVLLALDSSPKDDLPDGLDVLEVTEFAWGLGFVACQAYIEDAVSSIMRLGGSSLPTDRNKVKFKCLKTGELVSGTSVTKVQLIYSLGNYFKHHEEWPDWTLEKPRKWTIQDLAAAEIDEGTEFPCHDGGLRILDGRRLPELASILRAWRRSITAL